MLENANARDVALASHLDQDGGSLRRGKCTLAATDLEEERTRCTLRLDARCAPDEAQGAATRADAPESRPR